MNVNKKYDSDGESELERLLTASGVDGTISMSTLELMDSLMEVDPVSQKYIYTESEQAMLMIDMFEGKSFSDAAAAQGLETDFVPAPDNDTPEEEAWLQQKQAELELRKQKLPPVLDDVETIGTVTGELETE